MFLPKTYLDFASGVIVKAEEASVQTTNNTTTTLISITPETTQELGVLEIVILASDDTGGYSITGKKNVHWKMIAGTVTIINNTVDAADSLDGLTTATWTVDASAGTLRVRVTGETGITINWYCYYQLQSITLTLM